MGIESRNCQNCKKEFPIYAEDFAFYEKINVPPPTWCPDCRMIRRMAFWNERNFFKRITPSGGVVLSTYPSESPLKVMERDYWWSDKFDGLKYGRDYDFSKSFFDQLRELTFTVPFPARSAFQMVNSDYCNAANNLKDCYMCFNCTMSEDCMFAVFCGYIKNSMDILNEGKSESCYELSNGANNYKVSFSTRSYACRESALLYDCVDCNNCFGCVGLRHKQYYIWNEPYAKEDYFKKLEELNLGSYASLKNLRDKFQEFNLEFPRKYMSGTHNENVIGEDIDNSKNAKFCFEGVGLENVKYSQSLAPPVKDSYDYTNWGIGSELVYETVECGISSIKVKFCSRCASGAQNLEYCLDCPSSEDCLGCVGLKRGKYCIFNKQYSKEEYEVLRAKIIEHMTQMPYTDQLGRVYKYGEFFPIDMAPIAANESAIIDFTDMSKEKALEWGLTWREPKSAEYKATIEAKNLPDHIKDVTDAVTKEVISCNSCKKAYRIVPKELEFYKRFQIPLPRLCHNCRFKERIKNRNLPKWYERQCQCSGSASSNGVYANTIQHFHGPDTCPNTFTTAYSPDRPDIVYCEQCYTSEVV